MIYFLGIGPGDPELVTVKAARLIKEADIIYVPQSNKDGRSVAETIIAPYADKAKIRLVYMPMTKNQQELDANYSAQAEAIAQADMQGLKVVYVTLGDNMLYSTARYIALCLSYMLVPHEFVPGVPSYVAAANKAEISLGDRTESFVVAPMPTTVQEVADLAHRFATVVFMKVSMRTPVLMEYVKKYEPKTATLIHRLQLEGEEIIDLTQLDAAPPDIGYLSIAIVKW